MRIGLWPGWRVAAFWVAILAALAVIGAAIVIGSGVYNVGASSGHFQITTWLLEVAMRRSVAAHSPTEVAQPLDDPGLVRLGAGHYASGCELCHGAPGAPRGSVVRSMLPPPPPLALTVSTWSAEELYWIVKNGLKYTGMPAWPAQQRGDEVWAVVAFLRALPDLAPDTYRELIAADVAPDAPPGLETCARCHGDGNTPPTGAIVPKLAGQSPAYLRRAIEEYRRGFRPSGIMQPVAEDLGAEEGERFVAYYSRASRPASPDGDAPSSERIDRGRRIATEGLPERGIPPCLSCHSSGASPAFPILHGQGAPYLIQQLRLFRAGVRDVTTYGAIMSVVARRLGAEDAEDVALYFESTSEGAAGPHLLPATQPGRR